jgi:hypothetical protein
VLGEGLSAALDVGYAEYMGMVMYTDDDVVLVIRPLDGRSSGVIACTTCSGPQKLTQQAEGCPPGCHRRTGRARSSTLARAT